MRGAFLLRRIPGSDQSGFTPFFAARPALAFGPVRYTILMPPKIDIDKCSGCGECYEVCPVDPCVYEIHDGKSRVAAPEECLECGACESACPENAIEIELKD